MKIKAIVKKVALVEIEVDDKFAELANHRYYDIAYELEQNVENSHNSISEVLAVFDDNGNCLIDNS